MRKKKTNILVMVMDAALTLLSSAPLLTQEKTNKIRSSGGNQKMFRKISKKKLVSILNHRNKKTEKWKTEIGKIEDRKNRSHKTHK